MRFENVFGSKTFEAYTGKYNLIQNLSDSFRGGVLTYTTAKPSTRQGCFSTLRCAWAPTRSWLAR